MPMSQTMTLNAMNLLSVESVRQRIAQRTPIVPDPVRYGAGPAEYYRLPEYGISVGFIGAMTGEHFCDQCNKVRLTADGKIRPCLGHPLEFDLKPALREQPCLDELRRVFLHVLSQKPSAHLFHDSYQPDRLMTDIGG
jgi:cyclic pyranopterin phosphate synthase